MSFKGTGAGRRVWAVLVLPAVIWAVLVSLVSAGKLPRVWVDPANGYAIAGYDPVDYFVRARPVQPARGVEAFWGRVNWKFSNSGNRQAFLDHPEIYAPRFGGADPYMLATGKQVLGNPALFDIYKGRLYLFYSGVNHLRWRENRADLLARAVKVWPRSALMLGLDVGPSFVHPAAPPTSPAGPLPPEK